MCERARLFVIAAGLCLGLSFCGYRASGLEVALSVAPAACGAPSCGHATLDLAVVELLACPDVPPHVALAPLVLAGHARAHDGVGPAMGPTQLALPSGSASAVLAVPPGSYCDVRLHAGGPGTPALMTESGSAPEREVVLRLVDAGGAPTRLTLALAPDRAAVRVELGALDPSAPPARMLSQALTGAVARLVSR
jgi:hypothetical protein